MPTVTGRCAVRRRRRRQCACLVPEWKMSGSEWVRCWVQVRGVYPGTCRDERRRQGRDDGATEELSTVGKGAEGQESREDRSVGNLVSGRRED